MFLVGGVCIVFDWIGCRCVKLLIIVGFFDKLEFCVLVVGRVGG